jgi:hypothetical protein
MSIILSGSDGLSDVDGSASTPAIRGTDANTGIFFPAADTIAFAEGGAEVARFDSSGNLGIGTTSPTSGSVLDVASGSTTYPRVRSTVGSAAAVFFQNNDTGTTTSDGMYIGITGAEEGVIWNNENTDLRIATNNTERARITSDGVLRINNTANATFSAQLNVQFTNSLNCGLYMKVTNTSSSQSMVIFGNTNNDSVGSISTNGSATSYTTSSDYRLKENIVPMTGALAAVAQLKPVTYTWKSDGSAGQGFIAHELQAVVPDAVTGEKDAVNEDGSIKPQGVDTSFLVATLTAAIQELKAELDAAKTRIATLEAK